jgi:NitT/TauT family transport system permease protein
MTSGCIAIISTKSVPNRTRKPSIKSPLRERIHVVTLTFISPLSILRTALRKIVQPLLAITLFLVIWHIAVVISGNVLLPTPLQVVTGLAELTARGLLIKYIVASLFRVTWGFLGAALLALPLGMLLGQRWRGEALVNPLIQIFRPISPLAWIPIAILWFGVGDISAIFLIFLASFFSLLVSAMVSVRNVDPVHRNAGRNFGLSERAMMTRIIFPAIVPQLLIGLRITLGIAWLVVVAAEMIAVNSGLGFLIVDARNAGNRYDLVVGGMVMIGLIGLLLDNAMRRLERLPFIRWGYVQND